MGGLSFLTMGWIYALPGLMAGLVLLYFLKLKRREVTLSSTYLWRNTLNEMRVNSPFQKLRMNLLLLLQLLALILVVLALARPVSSEGGTNQTDAVLLIDVSASMRATDGGSGGKTRLARAVEEASRLVEDLGFGDRATIIAFCDEARVMTNMTDSKAALRKALTEIKATDRPTRLAAALNRVRALLNVSDRAASVHVFSDGKVGSLDGVQLPKRISLNYVRIGEQVENVGITGIDVHVASGLGDETRVFVSVMNQGSLEQSAGLDFYVDDRLIRSREVKLGAGGQVSLPFSSPILEEGGAHRVRVVLDHKDAFPVDDVAHALVKPPEPLQALLVSAGNLFLQNALSEDPQIAKNAAGKVPTILPKEFDPNDTDLLKFDLIVLDGFSPKALPAGNYLCFGARPPFPGFKDLGQVENTKVLDWDETHAVARFVNFASLVLPTSRRFKVREQDTVVVRATYGPLVIEARDKDRRAIVCSFDLLALPVEGAWTFDPSFPIFLANATRILGGRNQDQRRDLHLATGDTAKLRFPTGTAKATVDPPESEPYDVRVVEGDEVLHISGLDRSGPYAVTYKNADDVALGTWQFTANLVDAAESHIAPAETIQLEDTAVEGKTEARESNRDLWKWLAIAALLLVLFEWWIYNRRVYV